VYTCNSFTSESATFGSGAQFWVPAANELNVVIELNELNDGLKELNDELNDPKRW
jgi:hypothetical protein